MSPVTPVMTGRSAREAALLERAEFSDALDEQLASVDAGGGRLVLVSGEAGIGKSALVRAFSAACGERVRVLWGACDALGTPRPLSPLIDIAAAVGGPLLESVRAGEKPHTVFVALLDELRAVRPTVVVIEDVHWADEATLDIVRLLARRAESLGALVVVTYRESELEPTHPLRLAVGELGTAPGVTQLRLPPLTRAAVEELARAARRRRRGALRQDGRQPLLRHGGAGGRGHRGATDRARRGARAPEPAAAGGRRPCSRRSPSSRRTSTSGCSERSCPTTSSTSTPALPRACCRARGTPSRSATSSRDWRSSSRSDRTGARSSTSACSRRCASRPKARWRTRRSSRTTPRAPGTRARSTSTHPPRAGAPPRRERTARPPRSTGGRCARAPRSVSTRSRRCSSCTCTSST